MAVEKHRIFDSVLGHEKAIEKILNLVEGGRVPHSLLFVGAQGQGKKLVAYGLAQALLCDRSRRACGECPSCLRVHLRQSEGVLLLQPEKGQIKIEAARAAVHQLGLASWNKARVVIIDDANLLNPQAANALLKSIEEPPPDTYFVLLSPSQESVLKTLRSRSQILRFRQLSRSELAAIERAPVDVELREGAFAVWKELMTGHGIEAIDLAREHIDSREKGLQAAQFWLEFLRDQWFLQRGIESLTHGDWRERWAELGARDENRLSRLSQDLLALERDLNAHGDLQLNLEKFLREARV